MNVSSSVTADFYMQLFRFWSSWLERKYSFHYWAQISQTPCQTVGFFEAFSLSSLKTILFVQTNQVLTSPLSHGKQVWHYSFALMCKRYSWSLDFNWRYPKHWPEKHLLEKQLCPSFLKLNSNVPSPPKVGAAVLTSHGKNKTRSLDSLILLLEDYNPLNVLLVLM